MSQLKRLSVKNYRSLRDVDVELRPLNILIGANGSGKSNLLSLFELFRQAADEKMNAFINQLGGFNMMRTFQAAKEDIIWNFSFDGLEIPSMEHSIDFISYYVQLRQRDLLINYYIFLEIVDQGLAHIIDDIPLLKSGGGKTSILKTTTDDKAQSFVDNQEVDSEYELALSRIRAKSSYPELFALRRDIADWTVFRAFGNDTLKNIHTAQLLNVVQPLRLNPDGTNLISVLYHLREEARYADTYEQLMETMRLAFPDIDRFDIQLVGGGMGALGYRSKDAPGISIPASLMSDGQLRFLSLALLLALPEPPPLIAIDEPEIGLHPNLLPLLAGLLKQASRRTQIMVATHSPQLLDAEDITADDVIIADRENGNTKLERLSSERLAKWIESYSLGELWTRGTLDALRA